MFPFLLRGPQSLCWLCFQYSHRQDIKLALKELCESKSYLKGCLPRKGVIAVSLYALSHAMKAQNEGRGVDLRFLEPRRYMGLAGQRHAPVALPPGKGSGTPPQFEPRTVQPIASRCTDYTIWAAQIS